MSMAVLAWQALSETQRRAYLDDTLAFEALHPKEQQHIVNVADDVLRAAAEPEAKACLCHQEIGDNQCPHHPTCDECGEATTRGVSSCMEHMTVEAQPKDDGMTRAERAGMARDAHGELKRPR